MSLGRYVYFKRTGRGGSSEPGGWRGRRNLWCSSARGQTANSEGHRSAQNNISTNQAKKNLQNRDTKWQNGRKSDKWQKLFQVTKNNRRDPLVDLHFNKINKKMRLRWIHHLNGYVGVGNFLQDKQRSRNAMAASRLHLPYPDKPRSKIHSPDLLSNTLCIQTLLTFHRCGTDEVLTGK